MVPLKKGVEKVEDDELEEDIVRFPSKRVLKIKSMSGMSAEETRRFPEWVLKEPAKEEVLQDHMFPIKRVSKVLKRQACMAIRFVPFPAKWV
jgi:hypothetical protein